MSTEFRETEAVLLFDIPPSTYEGIVAALQSHQFMHTYDEGTLELSSNLLQGVSWDSYERILEAFGDRRFPHTYVEGTLEIMSPSEEHDWLKRVIGRFIENASVELGIPIKSVSSATRRRKGMRRGAEPDESYYVRHATNVGARKKPDPDSPPDLVVEIDLRRPALDRFDVYAQLGVTELWLYRKRNVRFFRLVSGAYEEVKQSVAFPLISSDDITGHVLLLDEQSEHDVVCQFIAWLRQLKSKNG